MNQPTLSNLHLINDTLLIEKTEKLVREERELLTNVLHHLCEIERRRLFSALGYKSLFDFAVKKLGYSEDQAYRRIAAMRLLKELPEIETQIENGAISLTHIGLVQSYFKQEKKLQSRELSAEHKLAVIEKIASKPVREAEKITLALSSAPELLRPDRISAISEKSIEMKFIATNNLAQKIETLKGLLAHKYPNLSLGELFEKLCDLGLKEWGYADEELSVPVLEEYTASTAVATKAAAPRKLRVNTKAQIIRGVFAQAKNKCENCDSSYALEVDHILPRAKGGSNAPNNLRLLCRHCNQRSAIEHFGQQTMDYYLG